ncbi:hypothetical protein RBH94_13515 [Aestuariibaculum sp. YM273]|uniref:hypothetical protein n=1 Tax=Aestuariibaculum sp. YM273 TaxID=3070659 RepID=UPI0027DD141C|nr:hypothetical protein [Aestuariibaculum sp. YM273]WMI65071.1 hypothetical protein RBH94_13515 [Aestuariibaculum sp. YM273]
MRQLLSIGILTLFLNQIGFSQSIDIFVDSTIKVDSLNVPTDLGQPYFPKEMFPEVEMDWIQTDTGTKIKTKVKEGTYDEFVVNWYSKHLHAMKEPLLFNRKIDKEIYRFTWLRTFDKPITFRFEKKDNRFILYWKVLNGAGGYEPGEIEIERLKILTKKEWTEFTQLMEKADFWNMNLGRSSIGTDGSEWIMEGVNQSDYRAVSVWSPSKGDFYNACDYLISLTNLKISEKKKY